jgi:hypothetical protein
MQPTPRAASKIGAILRSGFGYNVNAVYQCGAADGQPVGRARATHAMNGQRMIQPRNCCGPTANAREYRIRLPSQGRHPLPGQASAGNAFEPHPRARIRPPSWWERNRRERPRTVSRAAHATVIAPNCAEAERPRASSQAAPSGASTSGRSARASDVVPPNQRMQPDAAARRRDRRDFGTPSWHARHPDLSWRRG